MAASAFADEVLRVATDDKLRYVTRIPLSGIDLDVMQGELFVILGSGGYYEVSMSQGSAAAKIKCEAGAAIEMLVW